LFRCPTGLLHGFVCMHFVYGLGGRGLRMSIGSIEEDEKIIKWIDGGKRIKVSGWLWIVKELKTGPETWQGR